MNTQKKLHDTMTASLKLFLATVSAFAALAFFSSGTDSPEPQSPPTKVYNRTVHIPHVEADGDYWFAGERIPVENFDVRERLERELVVNTFYHSSTILNLKNATRFFPVIEPILKEQGIPDDFKYLAVAESNLRNETSPAGAKGFWQFMEGTAGDFDLEVNSEVDERYHLEKSTRAACEYLKERHKKFGSWINAAASYNMGSRGLSVDMDDQKFDNYFDLNLNAETSRYVFRIVAIKEVMEHPANFGFDLSKKERYQPLDDYTVVTVEESIPNLGDFAKKYGISYRMLKVYNPWLISHKLTVSSGKSYQVKIPRAE